MSHIDGLVMLLADAILSQVETNNANVALDGGPIIALDNADVTNPAEAWIEAKLDLTQIAQAITAAGWVHVDELDQLRKVAS